MTFQAFWLYSNFIKPIKLFVIFLMPPLPRATVTTRNPIGCRYRHCARLVSDTFETIHDRPLHEVEPRAGKGGPRIIFIRPVIEQPLRSV